MMLDYRGYVAEATGANVFFVRDGVLHTPEPDCFLDGITRRSVIGLAKAKGFDVVQRHIKPEELSGFSECFIVGTAAEVTPVRSVDKQQVGNGSRGPVTKALQQAFFDVINGEVPDTHGWLTYVYADEAPLSGARGAVAAAAKG